MIARPNRTNARIRRPRARRQTHAATLRLFLPSSSLSLSFVHAVHPLGGMLRRRAAAKRLTVLAIARGRRDALFLLCSWHRYFGRDINSHLVSIPHTSGICCPIDWKNERNDVIPHNSLYRIVLSWLRVVQLLYNLFFFGLSIYREEELYRVTISIHCVTSIFLERMACRAIYMAKMRRQNSVDGL